MSKWDKFDDTLQVAVRGLDNILDKNFYPSEEARKNTMDLRPIGIGLRGFAEALVEMDMAYDSEETIALARKIGSFMRSVTYRESQELAKERDAFDHYQQMEEEGTPYDYAPRRNAVLMAIGLPHQFRLFRGQPQPSIATLAISIRAIHFPASILSSTGN